MPFLRRLIAREHYQVQTMYSGLPATTPAVQGELLYGVRQVVPAFSFREHETGKAVWMIDPEEAARVQQRLIRRGAGLLDEGSSYSNIYTGSAAEAHFCASVMGWGDLWRNAKPGAIALFAPVNLAPLLRAFFLAMVEVLIALSDTVYGILRGRHVRPEFRLILSRVAVGVLLRDFITIGVTMDAARGLPIVHCNFLGYDEQAHRRGPGSNYAHWTLKGIDRAIHRIWKAVRRSTRRDYQLWLFSDHGQTYCDIYEQVNGRSLSDAVNAVFQAYQTHRYAGGPRAVSRDSVPWLGGGRAALLPKPRIAEPTADEDALTITALGPVDTSTHRTTTRGHSVLTLPNGWCAMRDSLVVTVGDEGQPWAFTADGRRPFRRREPRCLALNTRFSPTLPRSWPHCVTIPTPAAFSSVAGKTMSPPKVLCSSTVHTLVRVGGSRAFCLLPSDAPIDPGEPDTYGRWIYVPRHYTRSAGLKCQLHPDRVTIERTPAQFASSPTTCILAWGWMAGCRRGVLRVIAQCDPDVVVRQECDVRRRRTDGRDQVRDIAEELAMEFHFHPAIRMEEEEYGDAILSCLPIRLVCAGRLPGLPRAPAWSRGRSLGRC